MSTALRLDVSIEALNAAKDRGEIAYKFSENVANNDYERIMRQYSEEGSDLVIGEIFGVERAARRVAASVCLRTAGRMKGRAGRRTVA